MNDWAGIFWLVVLLLGNAFFVGAEFAVMSARRSQIEPLALAGSKRAQTTLVAMENVSLMLACAQLGITVCSLLILQVAEPAIHHLLAAPLELVGVPVELADVIAFTIALLFVTFMHVTFGEMVPKNISVSLADKAALMLAPPLMWIGRFVKPVIWSLNWLANHILRLMKIEPKDEVASSFTLEEVQSIVQESTRHGLVDDDAGLLSGALEFSEHTAAHIMVPLQDLVVLRTASTPIDVEKAVSRTGFSRFPMVDDDGESPDTCTSRTSCPSPRRAGGIPLPRAGSGPWSTFLRRTKSSGRCQSCNAPAPTWPALWARAGQRRECCSSKT